MSSSDLLPFFGERFKEVETYLDFLQEIENAAQSGPPRVQGSSHSITAQQQKILYSSVYLQLYNLVEATVSRCISAISDAASADGQWHPRNLNESLQQEWVRTMARTHIDLAPDKRLKLAVELCNHLLEELPVTGFEIEVGGGGNWDDESIERMSRRLGCQLRITRSTKAVVKRPLRDDQGALKLVKARRNGLAHGRISFVECADGIAVSELRVTTSAVGAYLQEVIECFSRYVDLYGFLRPEYKPQGAA